MISESTPLVITSVSTSHPPNTRGPPGWSSLTRRAAPRGGTADPRNDLPDVRSEMRQLLVPPPRNARGFTGAPFDWRRCLERSRCGWRVKGLQTPRVEPAISFYFFWGCKQYDDLESTLEHLGRANCLEWTRWNDVLPQATSHQQLWSFVCHHTYPKWFVWDRPTWCLCLLYMSRRFRAWAVLKTVR